AGFVPHEAYQDMWISVPPEGLPFTAPGSEQVRPARLADVHAMAELGRDVSGITRELDYRYCLENRRGFWQASVLEGADGRLEGYLISSGHPAVNLLGPGVARSETAAAALLLHHLNLYPGRS